MQWFNSVVRCFLVGATTSLMVLAGCGSTGPSVNYMSRIGAEIDVPPASSFVVDVSGTDPTLSPRQKRLVKAHGETLEKELARRGLVAAPAPESADVVVKSVLSFASNSDDCSNVWTSADWFPKCPKTGNTDVTIIAGTTVSALKIMSREGNVIVDTTVRRTRKETIKNDNSFWTAVSLGSKGEDLEGTSSEALSEAIVGMLTPSCEAIKTALLDGDAKQFKPANKAATRSDWQVVKTQLKEIDTKDPHERTAIAYNLGVAYEATGQLPLALEQFELCHTLGLEHPPFFRSAGGQNNGDAIEATDPAIKCNLAKRRLASRVERDGWFARNGVADYTCPAPKAKK